MRKGEGAEHFHDLKAARRKRPKRSPEYLNLKKTKAKAAREQREQRGASDTTKAKTLEEIWDEQPIDA